MKYSQYFLFIITIFSFFSVFSNSIPGPSDAVDIKHYTFRIELNDSTDFISGQAEISFICKKSITEFELDLIAKNVQGRGMQIAKVSFKGASLKFTQQNDRVKIFLANQVAAGEYIAISIGYSGIPQDGLIISKNKYGDRTFFADNWPDRGRNWLPIIDHPADKASVDFIVIAPVHYAVVANGIKVEESFQNKNQKLTRYKEEAEIPTKVMVIGVARFAIQQAGIINNIPVESWVYPQNSAEGFYDYAVATKVMDFFINHVGPYSYKKLANVQSKTTFGGLENASAIFYFENSVTGKGGIETLIAHEVAHQWFGNSATEKEWSHVWLSEGFATYFAHLYNEFTHGADKRKEDMKEDRDQVIAYYKKARVPIVDPTVTDLMKLLNINSYQKGSWILHMLRSEIGDQQFWEGTKEYYRQYGNGNALTSDFQHVMEAVSSKDLNYFFTQWIFKAGHPVLDGSWKYDEQSQKLQITLNQVQKGSIFNFPLEIGIYAEGKELPEIQKVFINKESQQFNIPIAGKPVKIVLDPNVNLLFEGKLGN